ncbi:acetoacetate decarboxylase family protein [Jatrophihabitans sp.]|uniref:acetoacetate decarboxylase family protein n=1 Tax=Jatrophihabitans sp. TaxID=1932789 RepID=UPI0030C759C6|nr:Acetoacetate decarboxylase [Jatrophihabitans sp.]
MSYPAEPWALQGQLHSSAFLVPLVEVPVDLPPGCSPVRVGRFGVVGAVWVDYEPGGVLDYRELMTVLLVRKGWQVMPTVTHIWVDSEASRDGGRALWGIPKQLASFDFTGADFAARDDVGPLAAGSVRPLMGLPGRWPTNFRVVQWLGGKAKLSPVRSRAAISLSRAAFDADPSGPLAFLAGRRPFASFTLRDFEMSFGSR